MSGVDYCHRGLQAVFLFSVLIEQFRIKFRAGNGFQVSFDAVEIALAFVN
jgi:hypothetical protein